MGTTKAEINASGHFVVASDTPAVKDTGTVSEGAGVVVGSVLVLIDSTGAKLKLYDASSEADCAAIVGISDGTYADTATASYFTNGDEVTGLAGLTIGVEYYADPVTGQPGLWASIGSSEWTRLLGVATSATTLQLQIGAVQQKA